MKGLIHIYTGEGKGKTTASVGLAVRFAGSGGKVIFAQFMKDNKSSEIAVLEKIKNIKCMLPEKSFGFSWNMTEEERQLARECYSSYLKDVTERAGSLGNGLLILDEVLGADREGLIPRDILINFLKVRPESLEVVLTGRNPAKDLQDMADYISEIRSVRHPYERGIPARRGVER